MSNTETSTITIQKITISIEDYAKIDSILANFPYKTVRPIFEILERAMVEEGRQVAKLQTQKAPELKAVQEEEFVRVDGV